MERVPSLIHSCASNKGLSLINSRASLLFSVWFNVLRIPLLLVYPVLPPTALIKVSFILEGYFCSFMNHQVIALYIIKFINFLNSNRKKRWNMYKKLQILVCPTSKNCSIHAKFLILFVFIVHLFSLSILAFHIQVIILQAIFYCISLANYHRFPKFTVWFKLLCLCLAVALLKGIQRAQCLGVARLSKGRYIQFSSAGSNSVDAHFSKIGIRLG